MQKIEVLVVLSLRIGVVAYRVYALGPFGDEMVFVPFDKARNLAISNVLVSYLCCKSSRHLSWCTTSVRYAATSLLTEARWNNVNNASRIRVHHLAVYFVHRVPQPYHFRRCEDTCGSADSCSTKTLCGFRL